MNDLIQFQNVELSSNGLTIKQDIDIDQWLEVGKFLKKAEGAVQFWIGDWLNYGERKYGEMYSQALEATDKEYGTLRNYKWVADRIELSRRRDNLTFSHHQEVAQLEPNEQDYWLERASEEGLSQKDLRRLIKQENRQSEYSKLSSEYNPDNSIVIEHGDFYSLSNKVENNSVDLILTDPPYPAEYLYLWEQMFEVANRVLKPGSFLIAYANHQNLQEIFRLKNNLKYYWTFKLDFTQKPIAKGRNLIATWKPVLIYQKEPFSKMTETIEDSLKFNYTERSLHDLNWGQTVGPFEYLLDKFSKPNDMVMEPFAGSGTTLVACQSMKRKCIGYEIEEKYIDIIKGRLI